MNDQRLLELNIANMAPPSAKAGIQASEFFYAPTVLSNQEYGFLSPRALSVGQKSDGSVAQTDSDGLINIILTQEAVDPNLQNLINEQKQNLIDLTGVGSAYVRRQAATDSKLKYSTDLWQQVFNHLPLMGPSKFVKENFSRRTKGVEIAQSFLNFILGTVIDPAGSILDEFGNFIRNQGEAIRLGTEKNQDGFEMGTIAIVLEVMKVGNEFQLVPKIKAYFVKFTRENYRFTSSCSSYEEVNIDFEYQSSVAVFNYRSLEDSDVKNKFDEFIGKQQKDDIENSENFFNGTFQSS